MLSYVVSVLRFATFSVYTYCRLYPVAFATSRKIAKEIELCGYHIPAGVCNFVCIMCLTTTAHWSGWHLNRAVLCTTCMCSHVTSWRRLTVFVCFTVGSSRKLHKISSSDSMKNRNSEPSYRPASNSTQLSWLIKDSSGRGCRGPNLQSWPSW